MATAFPIFKKELASTFAQPTAFIFLGVYLFVSLFSFFWVETFFARNIADVRPLFDGMPLLLIFLCAAITMKMWSEESRAGTIEFLLTSPVKSISLVGGKFLACLALVGIALALSVGVPLTVSLLGDLDWGPVLGAYLATLLLAAAYIAIGLFVSSLSDNQIVSLIITSLVCGLFLLVGSPTFVGFFGNEAGEVLKLMGTGSRFESVSRGVLDVRDIFYYLSLVGVFLSLNIYTLNKRRWSGEETSRYRKERLVVFLLVVNFLFVNFSLANLHFLRLDLTKNQIYSISDATKNIVGKLSEPLLIRGYFSAKTHPLLAPLVPQIRDTLKELAVVGRASIRFEFIDPREDEEIEAEAHRKYGIKPIPFHFSDKYQSELVNSYFDILIQYGDQHEVLSFRDLIEVKPKGEVEIEVQLRNLEYDIARSIKKVLFGFQNTDNLFSQLKEPVQFIGYLSEKELPEQLANFKQELKALLAEYQKKYGDKLVIEFKDPSANPQLAKQILDDYGFQPMALSLLDPQRFYFYMTLQKGDLGINIPIPQNLDTQALEASFEAGLKRMAPGFLKTVGLVTPALPQFPNPLMQDYAGMQNYEMIEEQIVQNYEVKSLDLASGVVDSEVDLLVVVAPRDLKPKQVFAIDQFLMKGGTVILATSPYSISQSHAGIKADLNQSGLKDWLQHHGIEIQQTLVLDPQNENFPVTVQRDLGGFAVQEIRMINYPYSVDVRGQGLNSENLITKGIPQMTMYWSSPLVVDQKLNQGRRLTPLLKSSQEAWVSDSNRVEPDFQRYPVLGFKRPDQSDSYTLALALEGRFDSFFKDKDSPLLTGDPIDEPADSPQPSVVVSGKIDKSLPSSRLIVFASNEFVADQTLNISRGNGGSGYLNNLQLVHNAIDYSLQDRALLSIRSRGQFARTLLPMDKSTRMLWEYFNYGLALLGLLIVYFIYRVLVKKKTQRLALYANKN